MPTDDCFLAHLRDLTRSANQSGAPRFTTFLTPGEIALLPQVRQSGVAQTLWGGWTDAERKMLCLHPDTYAPELDAFPLSCVAITYRRQDTLSHRDLLGAVLALGLERAVVGDILVDEGCAHLFACNTAASLLCEQLCRVGRVGVHTERTTFDGSYTRRFEPLDGTVASLRLDAVVRLAVSRSREQAAALISAQAVAVNGITVTSASAAVHTGDILSIRGAGKFSVADVSGPTKKGRLHITLNKYC